MGSVPDLAPFLRKPRGRTTPSHKVRPIMKLEWNKLLAEATEKDLEVVKDEVDNEDYYDDESEIETQENVEEKLNVQNNQDERPLNLCNKSHTMPMFSGQFPNSLDVLDLSAKKQKPEAKSDRTKNENAKSIPYTVSSFPLNSNSCLKKDVEDNKNSESELDNKENFPKVINNNSTNNNKNIYLTPINKKSNLQEANLNGLVSTEKIKSLNNNIENFEKQNVFLSEKKVSLKSAPLERIRSSKEDLNKKLDLAGVKEKPDQLEKQSNYIQTQGSTSGQKKAPQTSIPGFQKFAVPAAPRLKDSPKTLTINNKTYQILAPLGKGGSSKVYLVLNSEYELLAVKCVRLADVSESTKNDYLNEIQHLMKMQHCQHVIKLYDHQYLSSQKLLLAVMERGETDLSRFLKDKASSDEGISPELIMYYWTEMLMAVKSIHENNIIHRDLKPANFLLVSGRLKLIDFGIASSIQTEQTSIFMESQSGTFNYMSPEALQDLGFDNKIVLKIGRKTDVWSLGCILYYFLYKKTPYQDLVKPIQKLKAITDPNYHVPFPKILGVPDILIDSCKRCLVHDTKKRASIEELLAFKNRPLFSLSQVLGKLEVILSPEDYKKAEKAFEDAWTNDV